MLSWHMKHGNILRKLIDLRVYELQMRRPKKHLKHPNLVRHVVSYVTFQQSSRIQSTKIEVPRNIKKLPVDCSKSMTKHTFLTNSVLVICATWVAKGAALCCFNMLCNYLNDGWKMRKMSVPPNTKGVWVLKNGKMVDTTLGDFILQKKMLLRSHLSSLNLTSETPI